MSSNDDTTEKKSDGPAKMPKSATIKKGGNGAKEQKTMAMKPRKRVTAGWVFGMIILILIAISFVMAPAIEALVGGSNSSEIVFGQYGKDDIAYSQDSYFYDQVQNYANQYRTSTGDSTQTLYQIWQSAYNSTVAFTAINQMADKLGIFAADEVVKRAILDSGYYDKDGKFDPETFQATSAAAKASIDKSIRRTIPYSIVLDDIGTVLSSDAESDYVAAMAADNRSFDYVAIEPTAYPDDKASEYALMNKQLFYSMDLSVISVATRDEAYAISTAVADGSKSFEDAATESSQDTYAADGGEIGTVYYYSVLPNFKDTDMATQLLAASAGDVVGPFETPSGWALYKVNTDPTEADYTDATVLANVKYYLSTQSDPIIEDYLSSFADQFAADAQDDFEAAAEAANLTVVNVAATPLNIASSSFMNSFSITDSQGYLAAISTDEETGKTLYTEPVGTVLKPIKSGSAYVVVQVADESKDESMATYVKTFYDYYGGTRNQQDLEQAIFASDDFKDDFLNTFFTVFLSDSTT
jgi:parvulin-like peptidyl-prolyl isomerase